MNISPVALRFKVIDHKYLKYNKVYPIIKSRVRAFESTEIFRIIAEDGLGWETEANSIEWEKIYSKIIRIKYQ